MSSEFPSHPWLEHGKKLIQVYGAFGGRMDQTLASLHILHKFYLKDKAMDNLLVLYDDFTKMVYAKEDINFKFSINFDFEEEKGAGIIPMPSKSSKDYFIETKGYEWNLGEEAGLTQLSWDSIISTSNTLKSS